LQWRNRRDPPSVTFDVFVHGLAIPAGAHIAGHAWGSSGGGVRECGNLGVVTLTPSSFLTNVEPSWKRCLELAWEAFVADCVPVGSVLTDSDGRQVAEGRNRSQDSHTPEQDIAGTLVAHAEMNVLAALPPGDYYDHVLWSSLEPCFMCTGAVLHAHVGGVRYAAPDLVITGIGDLPKISPWVASRWPNRHGPEDGPTADIAALLPIAWRIPRSEDKVLAAARKADPELFDLARSYVNRGTLSGWRTSSLDHVLDAIWDDLAALGRRRTTGP